MPLRHLGFLIFGGLVLSQPVSGAEISGRILNERHQPLAGADVTVGQQTIKTDDSGRFKLTTPDANMYRLTLSHPDHYSSIQTFEHNEIDSPFVIPDVSLVVKKKGRVMFAFGGDVMMGRRFSKPYFGDEILIHPETKAQDTREIVQHIRPYMALADYGVVNLETQVAEKAPKERAPKSVTFVTPPETLDALAWAGIDYVTLGNNHTYDYLDSGLKSTIELLDKSPLAYSGAGLNQQQALAPHVENLAGKDYAMLGYVGWEGNFSPTQTASQDKGGAAYGSMENIFASVKEQVKANRLPIVQYHGSLEYQDEPSGVTEQRLKSALDAGAVMAIAHHPHVAQGFEVYNGKLIAYSMGNFVFDQFFYSTPHSLVLYVWMDEGRFHRAEIVPVYLQGYKPVPATGTNRFRTLRRLQTLSKRRGTVVTVSGGHGVISPTPLKRPDNELISRKLVGQTLSTLTILPWYQGINGIQVPDNIPYRLGRTLTNNGDFERFSSFDTQERGWAFSKKYSQLKSEDHNQFMQLRLHQGKAKWNMKNFTRVYKAGNPMTFTARVKVNKPAKLVMYWQGREKRQKLFTALNEGKKHPVGQISLTPEQGWVNVEFPFNSPRVGFRSFRTLLEIEGAEGAEVGLDDVSLIEWQSAYTTEAMPVFQHSGVRQATHIGFARPVTGEVKFSLE